MREKCEQKTIKNDVKYKRRENEKEKCLNKKKTIYVLEFLFCFY